MATPVDNRIEVILGSASAARLGVLRHAGLDPRVLVSDVDEDALLVELAGTAPADAVVALAAAKADAVVATVLAERAESGRTESGQHTSDVVIFTCDSMLLFRGELSGKPHTAEAAKAQWLRVRGHSAELLTGHRVTRISGLEVVATAQDTAATTIMFSDATDAEIDAYVATGEPLSVAGGFTLDGLGGWFIDSIDGDPSSVIGIGLPTVRRLLTRVDIPVAELWNV